MREDEGEDGFAEDGRGGANIIELFGSEEEAEEEELKGSSRGVSGPAQTLSTHRTDSDRRGEGRYIKDDDLQSCPLRCNRFRFVFLSRFSTRLLIFHAPESVRRAPILDEGWH